jgi:hypothetical protein
LNLNKIDRILTLLEIARKLAGGRWQSTRSGALWLWSALGRHSRCASSARDLPPGVFGPAALLAYMAVHGVPGVPSLEAHHGPDFAEAKIADYVARPIAQHRAPKFSCGRRRTLSGCASVFIEKICRRRRI